MPTPVKYLQAMHRGPGHPMDLWHGTTSLLVWRQCPSDAHSLINTTDSFTRWWALLLWDYCEFSRLKLGPWPWPLPWACNEHMLHVHVCKFIWTSSYRAACSVQVNECMACWLEINKTNKKRTELPHYFCGSNPNTLTSQVLPTKSFHKYMWLHSTWKINNKKATHLKMNTHLHRHESWYKTGSISASWWENKL